MRRVLHQVGEHVAHALAVGEGERQTGGDGDLQPVVFGEVGQGVPHRVYDIGDVTGRALYPECPGLQARHLQEVCDDAGEAVGLLVDVAQEVPLGVAVPLHVWLEQRAGEPLDGGQRGAKLVRDVGQELAPQAVELAEGPGAARLLVEAGVVYAHADLVADGLEQLHVFGGEGADPAVAYHDGPLECALGPQPGHDVGLYPLSLQRRRHPRPVGLVEHPLDVGQGVRPPRDRASLIVVDMPYAVPQGEGVGVPAVGAEHGIALLPVEEIYRCGVGIHDLLHLGQSELQELVQLQGLAQRLGDGVQRLYLPGVPLERLLGELALGDVPEEDGEAGLALVGDVLEADLTVDTLSPLGLHERLVVGRDGIPALDGL